MYFADALTLDAPRRTSDGYMAVRARAARTGIYQYTGREVDPTNAHGLRDEPLVNVLRDEGTVFDTAAARSFIGKPVTDDHPSQPVTAANWRDHARGVVMGAMRDGEYLTFDLLLTDAGTIGKVDAGKRDLSNGYSAELEFGAFKAADGTVCPVRQAKITGGNHVALVKDGRAGKDCAIRDAAVCDRAPVSIFDSLTTDGAPEAIAALKKAIALHKKHMNGTAPTTGSEGEKSQLLMMTQMENALSELETGSSGKSMKMDQFTDGAPTMKTMLIDGLTVDISNADTAQATIATILAARDAANGKVTALETQVATLTTDKATLEAEVKTLADAKPTPAQLRDAARQFAIVTDKAKAHGVTVTDAMDEGAIIKATVLKHLGDAAGNAKDWTDAQFASSFAMLKDAKPSTNVHPLGAPQVIGDAAAREQQAFTDANDFNAWRAKSAA